MERRTITLETIEEPDKNADVLEPDRAPALKGTDRYDMVCGECGTLLIQGLAPATMRLTFMAPGQMVIKCTECSSFNKVPSTLARI